MKTTLLFVTLLLFITSYSFGNVIPEKLPGALNTGFLENKGQVRDQYGLLREDVRFVFYSGNFSLLLCSGGFSYQLIHYNDGEGISEATGTVMPGNSSAQFTIERTDARFRGMSDNLEIITDEVQEGRFNFYQGRHDTYPQQVHQFNKITYHNIYKNIDLVFYAPTASKPLRYEYIVRPGGNPADIRIEYHASNGIRKDENGSVLIPGSLGFIKEENLYAYQEDVLNGIDASFKINSHVLSFNVGHYQKNKSLVIDPDIVWGTYFGTDYSNDVAHACEVDGEGNVFLAGLTSSTMNFATTGSYQSVYGGGDRDAFVMKWSAAGNLIWCTYYGGSYIEQGLNIYIDAKNMIYSSGTTNSANCPVLNAFQSSIAGATDCFLIKLDENGLMKWATYYGGNSGEEQLGLYGDSKGNICFSGVSYSTNNMVTAGSHQPIKNLQGDGFIAKFDSNGLRLWGTYYGGEGDDRLHALTIDGEDNVIVMGTTSSATGLSTAGTHQPDFKGGIDAFIGKFSSAGNLLWGTYYGGSNDDRGRECITDESGNIYITGFTVSSDFIATPDAYQTTWVEAYEGTIPLDDAYYAKLDPNGLLLYGTYIGGDGDEEGLTVKLFDDGQVLIGGNTSSAGLGTNGTYQSEPGGKSDAFLAKFTTDNRLFWFTYYGGNQPDEANGVDIDGTNTIYLCGNTSSLNGIATPGAYKTILTVDSLDEGILAKFKDRCFDHYEPNNSKDTSTLILLPEENSTMVNGEINFSGDKDFYSFSNSLATPNIKLVLSGLPANYDLVLYKPSGAKAVISQNPKKQKEKIIYNTSVTGLYKIKVQGATNAAFSDTACYDLFISVSNAPFKLDDDEMASHDEEESQMLIYPNPASTRLYISTESDEQFAIYDLLGRKLSGTLSEGEEERYIDVSNFNEGVYLFVQHANNHTIVQRFLIVR